MSPSSSVADSVTASITDPNSDTSRRVLHVINGEHYSGAERVQDLLGSCLPESGYEVGFACVKPDKFPRMRQTQEPTLYQLPMKTKFDLRVAKSLAQIVRFGGYDLLHAHTTRTALIGRIAAALAQVPLVYHVHSPTSDDSTRRVTNKINAYLERVSLTGVSRIICVSRSLAEHMESQGYDPTLITVVPNGVPSRGELQDRHVPETEWVIGTIALFRPRKGTEILLESLSLIREQGHNVRLRAVGPFETREYETKISDLAKHYHLEDAIDWIGFTSDVDAELDRMDVMVLPSLFGEGLPMVVLEAMAAGVPVVGTDVQGVPEVLSEGNGLVAAPGCAKDLAECICKLIRGELSWTSVRENAWRRHAECYSARSMAAGVAAVYNGVLDGVGVVRTGQDQAVAASH
jgi:glycosyltransferase involved in cell wall biosynthesis